MLHCRPKQSYMSNIFFIPLADPRPASVDKGLSLKGVLSGQLVTQRMPLLLHAQ